MFLALITNLYYSMLITLFVYFACPVEYEVYSSGAPFCGYIKIENQHFLKSPIVNRKSSILREYGILSDFYKT